MRRVIRILVCTRLQRELESGIEKIVITHIKVWVKQYEQQIAATCLAIICCVASSGVMLACYYLLLYFYLSQSPAETCNIVVIRSTLCSNCNAKLLLHKVKQFVATQIETICFILTTSLFSRLWKSGSLIFTLNTSNSYIWHILVIHQIIYFRCRRVLEPTLSCKRNLQQYSWIISVFMWYWIYWWWTCLLGYL